MRLITNIAETSMGQAGPEDAKKNINSIIKFVDENKHLATEYRELFHTTLEYLQFLANDGHHTTRLHQTKTKLTAKPVSTTTHLHTKVELLNHFRDLYLEMAATIQADKTGDWGPSPYPEAYMKEYEARKAVYERCMEKAWKETQEKLTMSDTETYWKL